MYEQIETFISESNNAGMNPTFRVKRTEGVWHVSMVDGNEVLATYTGATLSDALALMERRCATENRAMAEENGQ